MSPCGEAWSSLYWSFNQWTVHLQLMCSFVVIIPFFTSK